MPKSPGHRRECALHCATHRAATSFSAFGHLRVTYKWSREARPVRVSWCSFSFRLCAAARTEDPKADGTGPAVLDAAGSRTAAGNAAGTARTAAGQPAAEDNH